MGSDWKKIGDIAEVFDGPHATPKKINNGPFFLSISSLDNGNLDLSKSAHISEEHFAKWTRRVTPREGDLLFSYETRLGAAALMPGGIKACLGRRMGLLRPDTSKVVPQYFVYAYLGPDFQQEIRIRTNPGATVDRISLVELRDFPIRIPAVAEQKAIAHILGTLDDKIELNRQMNETLESMARALFKSWFVDFDPVIDNALAAGNPIPEPLHARAETRRALGAQRKPLPAHIQKLFPDAFHFDEGMGWIPKGWTSTNFGEILESTIGGDWGKDEQDEKHSRSVVIIRGADIPDVKQGRRGKAPERWVEEKKFDSRKLRDGDIVLEVSGGSATHPTGRSLYMTQSTLDLLGGSVVPASFCRRFRPKTPLLALLATLHLQTIYDEGKMWGYQNQSTGLSNFQTRMFLGTEHVLVPKNELILEALFQKVRPLIDRSTNDEHHTLTKLRDTLLPKLLSGELRIPDAEQLVAGSL